MRRFTASPMVRTRSRGMRVAGERAGLSNPAALRRSSRYSGRHGESAGSSQDSRCSSPPGALDPTGMPRRADAKTVWRVVHREGESSRRGRMWGCLDDLPHDRQGVEVSSGRTWGRLDNLPLSTCACAPRGCRRTQRRFSARWRGPRQRLCRGLAGPWA